MSRYPRPLQNQFDVPTRRFLMKSAVAACNPVLANWVLFGFNSLMGGRGNNPSMRYGRHTQD